MKIHGLLSWFDETPSFLAAAVAAASQVCDHIIALDGAYALLPAAEACSPIDQAQTIQATCQALRTALTIHQPGVVWPGEVEKRDAHFQLARTLSTPGDWWLIFDADEVVTHVPDDLRATLEATHHDVATTRLIEHLDPTPSSFDAYRTNLVPAQARNRQRVLLRHGNVRVHGGHSRYVRTSSNGVVSTLRGPDASVLAEALDTQLTLEHRKAWRPQHRADRQRRYYETRDTMKVES